jgi:hypothetical protein
VYRLVLIVTLNRHVQLKIFNFICPFVTNLPTEYWYIGLHLKIFMLSPSMPFILHTSCCYIHLNQITQLILPECSSFSFPHLIFSSIHLSFLSSFCQFHLSTSQSSPAVPFCLTHKTTTVTVSVCIINYFMNPFHEELYFPLHK